VRAQAVTAPSHWVARALSRGMLIRPEVIYHGVDADAWEPEASGGYVLWNKARADVVSDPRPVNAVAALLPDVPFVTTFGERAANVHVTGSMPLAEMTRLVQRAGVYLATTRETFGIGTLEALAAGVPVVGYAFGGQREIITDETGVLVAPGDVAALAEAIAQVLAHRPRYSAACRADAIARWGWRDRIAQYAALYARVVEEAGAARPRVSVVITSYNLNAYLPDAVASCAEADEVIVVDDCGQEDAREVYPAAIRPPQNLGLSGARNFGARAATGRYLLFLDADDALAPGAVQTLADALDRDPALHIAGGGLQIMGRDDVNPWPAQFDWLEQTAHLNSLHYAAMWRRDAFVRTGGYRARDWRAEDASLWLRVTAQGLRAQQVTRAPTLLYRIRPDSKSQQEAQAHADRDGDWTAWYPWRLGAATPRHGRQLLDQGARPDPRHVPFGAPPPGERRTWPIPHREHPVISVVIPVGPGHAPLLVDALDSLVAQTFGDWEAIVVNDTGAPLPATGHPWAAVVETAGQAGAGAARNRGLLEARAPLVLFLDADDVLRPEALETLLRAYAEGGASYVYPDCLIAGPQARVADAFSVEAHVLPVYRPDTPDPFTVAAAAEYDQALFLASGYADARPGRHSVTALIETEALRAVGGFDETLAAWEDWEVYLKLAAAGFCGRRVARPLLVYRLATGQRRIVGTKDRKALQKAIGRVYAPYAEGKQVAKRCCGGHATVMQTAQQALAEPEIPPAVLSEGPALVRMRYVGALVGEHTVLGRPSNTPYRVGNNPFNKFFNADPRDVAYLTSLESFEVVR
ncbi:MAG TPA: glycosyltransferase, partial [Vicinamibacteria bacterium]|nr:glycosyltransferase [Vicinamibacteria bacterium]